MADFNHAQLIHTSSILDRLLRCARVREGHIYYEVKEVNKAESIYTTRRDLHSKLYNHKTGTSQGYYPVVAQWTKFPDMGSCFESEPLVTCWDSGDALLAPNDYLKLAEAIRQPERYIHLTDGIMYQIQASAYLVGIPFCSSYHQNPGFSYYVYLCVRNWESLDTFSLVSIEGIFTEKLVQESSNVRTMQEFVLMSLQCE